MADRGSALRAPTWYEATSIAAPQTEPARALDGARFDTVVVGGGLAGVTTALELARAGQRVALCEAQTIGSGASGRNGGFCSAGWAAGDQLIRGLVGEAHAETLAGIGQRGLEWMRARAFSEGYRDCLPSDGWLTLSLHRDPSMPLQGAALQTLIDGPRYRSGATDPLAFHFHPLNFLRLLTAEALSAGVRITEQSAMVALRPGEVHLSGGATLRCDRIVLTTGGYGRAETGRLSGLLLPIQTFIAVTAPMEGILARHIPSRAAISDTRRAGNYFRRLHDGRLLWGMGISAFGTGNPDRIRSMAASDIAAHLPGLWDEMRSGGVGFDFAWSGHMGYARHFMPYVGEIAPGVLVAAGFGGHGMNTAPAAGLVLAEAILAGRPVPEAFRAIPRRATFGPLGRLAAEATYRWLTLRDGLQERRG